MVQAGKPVDEVISQLVPLLSKGDILIDGGNSFFQDTIRRAREAEARGLLYVGPECPVERKARCMVRASCPGDIGPPTMPWEKS